MGSSQAVLDVGFVNPQGQTHMRDVAGRMLRAAKEYIRDKREGSSADRLYAEEQLLKRFGVWLRKPGTHYTA